MVSRLIIGLTALILVATSAVAEEQKMWSVDSSAAFYSDYMFRGFRLYDGLSLQPSVTGNLKSDYGTLSANLWMHVSGDSGSDKSKFTELDETIRYTYSIDPVTFTLGNVWYTYPDKDDDIKDSAEVFASAALALPLNPVFSVYHDYDLYDAQYYELGLSHTFSELLGNGATLSPFVAFGFGSNAEKVYKDDGLEQVTFGSTMTIPVGALSVVPSVNYTAKVDDATVNQLWLGTSLNYSF